MINRNIFLQMPKEMLSAILEQLPNPVYALRDGGTVLYANQAAQSVLGLQFGMALTERDGIPMGPGWLGGDMLSQEPGIQDIFRIHVNGVSYLCFQKYVPDEEDKSIFSVVSVQREEQRYDLFSTASGTPVRRATRDPSCPTPRRWSRCSAAVSAAPPASCPFCSWGNPAPARPCWPSMSTATAHGETAPSWW